MKLRIVKPEDNFILALLSWIHILLLFGGIYLVVAALGHMSSAKISSYLLYDIFLLIPAISSWIFIRKFRTLWAYLLGSIIVCLLIWKLSASVVTTLLSVLLFLIRCYTRLRRGQIKRAMQEMPGEAGAQLYKELWEIPTVLDAPSPVHWSMFVIYYVMILISGQYTLLRWVFFLLFFEIFVCFIYRYLERMQTFIRENQKIANLPVHTIQRVGRILLAITLISLFLVLLPSVIYNREPLIGFALKIRTIDRTTQAETLPDFQENFTGSIDFNMFIEDNPDPPLWLTITSDIFMYFSFTLAGILMLIFIYRLCRNAAHYFAQDEEDEVIFLGMEERQAITRTHRAGKLREKRTSPNQKIRRYYKKTLRRAMKEKPFGWETPTELEQKAALETDDRMALLHGLYEKARYSNEACSESDWKSL